MILRSNQTVAGLKRYMTKYITKSCSGEFKSDRCGIETRIGGHIHVSRRKFKSDRCGIETVFSICAILPVAMFKSDRCGIETFVATVGNSSDIQFKSDRCGIETSDPVPFCFEGPQSSNQTVAGLKP